MKRLIIVLVLFSAHLTTLFSQRVISSPSVTRTEVLKTTDLGNQKLQAAINDGDTIYALSLATGHSVRVMVGLGNTDAALKLLQWLYDYEPKKGDIIDLENDTYNVAKWQGASGYLIYSEGKMFKGHLRKPNIKGFIQAIKEYAHRE